MFFLMLIILFWVTTRIGLHVLMLKHTSVFLILSSAAALYSPTLF